MKSWSRRILRGISLKFSFRVLIHRRFKKYLPECRRARHESTKMRRERVSTNWMQKVIAIVRDGDFDIYIYIIYFAIFFWDDESSDLRSTIFDNCTYSKSYYDDIMCLLHTSFSEHSLRFLRAFVRMQSLFLHCPKICGSVGYILATLNSIWELRSVTYHRNIDIIMIVRDIIYGNRVYESQIQEKAVTIIDEQ